MANPALSKSFSAKKNSAPAQEAFYVHVATSNKYLAFSGVFATKEIHVITFDINDAESIKPGKTYELKNYTPNVEFGVWYTESDTEKPWNVNSGTIDIINFELTKQIITADFRFSVTSTTGTTVSIEGKTDINGFVGASSDLADKYKLGKK
ncbi:hypothetical protein GXB78_13985 [Pseudomonas moraviensis subsp. stanleyae]|uniref:hypothetical protein n=1 Tax=Pseudomonas moraviensis TaxID=321662 RepID=UPI002E3121EE|nr:hypothetical protein [Pseudomonas moraviensis]MED7668306.1 hypothetical protein [Pseudomonas moraviensis subsp. stanleyae]